MKNTVFFGEMMPRQFEQKIKENPVGFLPLGTIEWHSWHNALGADYLEITEIFKRAAERFGGIVFPPLWLGPDRTEIQKDGSCLIGMDSAETTQPHRQLPGSCYWVSEGLFIQICEAVLTQAKRSGFKCIVAFGHGPSTNTWARMAPHWENQFGLKLFSDNRDFDSTSWPAMRDHAGKNETSIMMALNADYVDLSQQHADRSIPVDGIYGEDSRDACTEYGEELIEKTVSTIGSLLSASGFNKLQN